ncbi:unnamed protein product [Closterium sp. Yama58-4]|nr:unnamed protein product [Closterium sp. Yama58-4]
MRSATRVTDSFCQLTSLETFTMSECGEMDQLPNRFCNLTSLQTLCIVHIEEWEDFPIPECIAGFPQLHTLYLKRVSVHQLLPSLPRLTSLTRLELDSCQMEEDLPRDLGKLSNLQQLHIRSCPIRKLPASFTALTSLQTLTIEHCNQLTLELPSRVTFLPDLSMLLDLRRLTLKLYGTGQGAAGIGSSRSPRLNRLQNVEYLNLTLGAAVEKFPFPRFPFPQLRILKISFGDQIQRLPSNLGFDLPQLR